MNQDETLLINTRIGFRIDWINKLITLLHARDFQSCCLAIPEFQSSNGMDPTGIIDAHTRQLLIREFPDLGIRTIGQHLNPRCILNLSQTENSWFTKLEEILLADNHFVSMLQDSAQILAIRGVRLQDDGWYQTESALKFSRAPYGSRTHFSSNKPDYLDSVFALMWREQGCNHVNLFPGTVNPNSIWPNGTAHLCMGQYFYRIGRHRTRDADHIRSVLDRQGTWPDDWFFDITQDSVQYIALEGTSPIEVVRSHGDSLDISPDDIERAESAIARRSPDHVDACRIKINIHTCASSHASSLGCQNIPPDDYMEFMHILNHVAEIQSKTYGFVPDIPYSLIDASFIE